MSRRYYCDYCDKTFIDDIDARKKHINGLVHQNMRREHYLSCRGNFILILFLVCCGLYYILFRSENFTKRRNSETNVQTIFPNWWLSIFRSLQVHALYSRRTVANKN